MNPDGTPTAVGGPKPERPGNRKMATLASVYTVDRHFRDADEVVRALFREQTPEDRRKDRPRAKNKRMTACFPEVQFPGTDDELVVSGSIMAWTWAQEEILRRHQPDQPVVRVCDGQESLWTSSDACLALPVPTVDILDIIHVTQYVWKAGKAFHGDDKGAVEQFVRDRLLRILEGETPSVIRGMRRMMHTRNLKGAARKQVSTVCGYFESNRHRMRYDEYLAAGYPIASGVIEGACRHLVKDRMERTGMRWSLEGAKGMLFVRAIHASELWEEFIAFRRRRDLDRNHPYRELIKDYEPGVAIAI
jgi:hypothetical protein